MVEHDVFGDDAINRIHPDEWRRPRVVSVTVNNKGQMFWGELSRGDCGEVMDTTLNGRVLDLIEREVSLGKNGGSVVVDGIEYVFIVDRDLN